MSRPQNIDLCSAHLFDDVENLREILSPSQVEMILRARAMYLWYLEHPDAKDAQFVETDCNRHKVSRPTAYTDLAVIQAVLPGLSQTTRDFHRWRYNEMILSTFQNAKTRGDVRTMERAATSYARNNNISAEEVTVDPAEMIVQPFIPTMDPSVLGINPIPNVQKLKKSLIERYSRDIPDFTDVDFEEVDVNANHDNIVDRPLRPD